MRAKHREVRRFRGRRSGELRLEEVGNNCKMKLQTVGQNHAEFKVPISLWSYGERILLTLTDMDDGFLADVNSECSWPLQAEDWGKNKKNVARVIAAIERQLNGTEGRPVPFCRKCGYLLAISSTELCPECGARGRENEDPRGSERTRMIGLIRLAAILTLIELMLIGVCAWFGSLPRQFMLTIGFTGAVGLAVINFSTLLVVGLVGSVLRRRSRQ